MSVAEDFTALNTDYIFKFEYELNKEFTSNSPNTPISDIVLKAVNQFNNRFLDGGALVAIDIFKQAMKEDERVWSMSLKVKEAGFGDYQDYIIQYSHLKVSKIND